MSKEYHTRCRKSIMSYVEEHREQRFSAADIYSYLRDKGEEINITTIYRNLEKLTESEILIRCKSPEDDRCLYQYVEPESDCNKHLHMQCRKCAKIIHIEGELMERITHQMEDSYGFELECRNSLLSGICEDCKKQ
ncbi:MAG: Fur family transcriptional regulator [Wujia sp.]